MAITELIHTKVIETFRINYMNGILCDIIVENGEMIRYQFKTKKEMVLHIVPDLGLLRKTPWHKHSSCIQTELIGFKELEKFEDFDKLYYVGGSNDGMVFDRHGLAIATLIRVNEMAVYHRYNINTLERAQNIIPFLMKCDMITDIKTVVVQEYNMSEEYADTSLIFEIMPTDELYREILGKERYFGMNGEHKLLDYIWDKYGIPRYESTKE